ncbi:hypothetical protein CRG98_029457 [Punica granatum]|uniref:Uncharacterized protein n=1 Tax=Punica granatum TaxID=22663 RepID=A0A2I0J255_PUNGR|nr:hypothetical protein CRG98_029457 [Punica granatum]
MEAVALVNAGHLHPLKRGHWRPRSAPEPLPSNPPSLFPREERGGDPMVVARGSTTTAQMRSPVASGGASDLV